MHDEGPLGCLVGIVIGCLIGASIGGCCASAAWKRDVIKRGAGEYDSETGFFKWAEESEATNDN